MDKNKTFSGQPIFTQLFKQIPAKIIQDAVRELAADHYYKKFDTVHHLVSMLYCTYEKCTSIREVITGLNACQGRLQSLGMKHLPARSTLSDANKKRDYQVFEKIFFDLLEHYRRVLPDSRSRDAYFNRLIIIDATTITLFKEILKAAGTTPKNGKRKGGIKVHMAVNAREDIPYLVKFTSSATNDRTFMPAINPPKGSIIVMDKGYNSFSNFNRWKASGVDWVTRINNATVYEVIKELPVAQMDIDAGVLSDQIIRMGFPTKKEKVTCRLVKYLDSTSKKQFEFITSSRRWAPRKIADMYKHRWQIELLFKRLKQNMPLHNFLGDNENAIKIQIFCALISDLLLKIKLKQVKRKWCYSNVVALVRLHLVNYTDLVKFMENPDKCAIYNPPADTIFQLSLFPRTG